MTMDIAQSVDGDLLDGIHPDLARFLDHWYSKRGTGGALPTLGALDPASACDLGHTLIYDAEPYDKAGGLQFCCRYFGAGLLAYTGIDFTGLALEEIFPLADARLYSELYAAALAKGNAHYWRRHCTIPERTHTSFERVAVPFADPGQRFGSMFSFFRWLEPPPEPKVLAAESKRWRSTTAADAARRNKRGKAAKRKNYRVIVETGQFPIAGDCAFGREALQSTDHLLTALEPVLRTVWRAMSGGSAPRGQRFVEFIEPDLNIKVRALLQSIPMDEYERFVAGIRPHVEALRAAVVATIGTVDRD